MPKSPHIPGLAGGIETVNGELTVDTGIRRLRSVVVQMNEPNIVPDEESEVSWFLFDDPPNTTQKIVLRVEKGGANHGLVGDSPVQVSWIALGD